MRRTHFFVVAVIAVAAAASGHGQVVAQVQTSTTVLARVGVDEVVARLMTFDHNRDGKVERNELAERMHNVVARGDLDRDGALDGSEIRTLATAPVAAATVRGFPPSRGYTFGDQVGVSTRSHIQNSIDDLRLADSTRELALSAANSWYDRLERTAAADLLNEMRSLLTSEQLADFKAALERNDNGTFVTLQRTFPANPDANNVVRAVHRVVGFDLGRRIAQYGLTAASAGHATVAIERHRMRLRMRDAERAELLAQMNDILTDEERDDLRAALERRPLVQIGSAIPGVAGGMTFMNQGGVVRRTVLTDQDRLNNEIRTLNELKN